MRLNNNYFIMLEEKSDASLIKLRIGAIPTVDVIMLMFVCVSTLKRDVTSELFYSIGGSHNLGNS